MKVRDFMTWHRVAVLGNTVMIGALLVLITYKFLDPSSLMAGLFINLAATAFATGVALTYIDYALSKEKDSSVMGGYLLANGEINTVLQKIDHTTARLYGFDFLKIVRNNRGSASQDILSILDKAMSDYMEGLTIDQKKNHLVDTEYDDAQVKYDEALLDIQMIFSLYDYALHPKDKNALLSIRSQLKTLSGYMAVIKSIGDDKLRAESLSATVMNLYEIQKKGFPKHYEK